eukprot:6433-Heterococcus_DN1.PRE.5
MDAVTALMRRLKLPITAFRCAGTKDKVAVTYQRCVIKGVHPRALLSINGQINGIEVGNVKYLSLALSCPQFQALQECVCT